SHGEGRRAVQGGSESARQEESGGGEERTGGIKRGRVSKIEDGRWRDPSILYPRSSISFSGFFETPDGVNVVRRSSKPRLHRVDGQMSRPEFFPLDDLLDPRLGRSFANRKSSFNTAGHGITSGFPRVRMNLCECCRAGFVTP